MYLLVSCSIYGAAALRHCVRFTAPEIHKTCHSDQMIHSISVMNQGKPNMAPSQRVQMTTSKNAAHAVPQESGDTKERMQKRRRWVRYGHKYSNSMWHTGYKQLDDQRWLIVYEDDASRFVTGWGVFDEATAEHAIRVLDFAISRYGKPKSILTNRSPQFYATDSKTSKEMSKFQQRLKTLGIRHMLAGMGSPHTNAKLKRLYGEVQRKLTHFFDVAGPPSSGSPINTSPIELNPMARFMKWYNHDRPHMSLDMDTEETPARAFRRKMPPKDLDTYDK